jgi:ABC-type branched-subunit amino acid transport system ATPase component
MSSPLLELCAVHATYSVKEVLRGVSLTIRTGEMVALRGENGAGKSSILKVVAGLLRPSQGTVYYKGHDLAGLAINERPALGIGYLMQGGRVFPNLTVEENYNLAASEARRVRRPPTALGEWFPTLRDRRRLRAGILSGGQRQMLAIELSLAQLPELLLLDEPTAALSDALALGLLERIRRYVLERPAAALVVEHSLAISDFATRHLHLINGVVDSPDRRQCNEHVQKDQQPAQGCARHLDLGGGDDRWLLVSADGESAGPT